MPVELAKPIKRAARAVAFQWPGVIEAEEVEQEIYLKLLESPGSVDKIMGMEDAAQYRAIIGIGHQRASSERASFEHFSGDFRYSVNEVRKLLESGALKQLGHELGSSWADDVVKNGDSVMDKTLTKVSVEQDLRRGMAALERTGSQYASLITRRYLMDEVFADDRDRQALRRALPVLATKMNHSFKRQHAEYDSGPGTRRAVSSAKARRISAQQYHGAYDGTGAGYSTRVGEF